MKVKGEGTLIGQSVKISQKTGKTYCIVKIQDEDGNIFEMLADKPNTAVEIYKRVEFTCDVIQGKYPRYNLLEIKK